MDENRELPPIEDYIDCQPEVVRAFEKAYQARTDPAFVDTCIEHGPGGTLRLSFQIRVF